MTDNIYRYENDVTWSLPCLFQYEAVFGAMQHFAQMLGFKPFKADIYGAPATIWSGGRKPAIYDKLSSRTLTNLFKYVNDYNGTPVLAFNCTQITPEDLKDEYANFILDIALEHNCKFMVYSDILKNHIKNKKPDAYVIASILKPIFYFQGPNRIENPQIERETEFYHNLLKDYDMVALRAEYSKFALAQNTTLIKDLSRVQVLINQSCLCNCNLAQEHIKFNEDQRTEKKTDLEFICPKFNMPTIVKYKNNSMHTSKEIQTLLNAGVGNIKLKGRGGPMEPAEILQVLISWIYNNEGGSYLFPTGLSGSHLDIEINYFNQCLVMKSK